MGLDQYGRPVKTVHMTLYENAIDLVAQEVIDHFRISEAGSYLGDIKLDVDDDELIYYIDLIEDGCINIPETPGQSISKILSVFRASPCSYFQIPYNTVIENYISDNWVDAVDAEMEDAVCLMIRKGGIENPDALFGGEFEAEKCFVFAVCEKICEYIRAMSKDGIQADTI